MTHPLTPSLRRALLSAPLALSALTSPELTSLLTGLKPARAEERAQGSAQGSAQGRAARVAALRLIGGAPHEQETVAYLSQLPALTLRAAAPGRVEALTREALAAALPADLDLSACGERCPQVVARAIGVDFVTHGELFQITEGVRARVLVTEGATGAPLIDEMISAPTLSALEPAILARGELWRARLSDALLRASNTPLATPRAEGVRGERKARWESLGVEWVPLSGGRLSMGSDEGPPNARPAHGVEVGPYSLMRGEVTGAQYSACVKEGACTPTGEGPACTPTGPLERRPVNCVSWEQGAALCAWLGARLPTEAEWELAARGLEGRPYPWGEARPTCELTNFSGRGRDTGDEELIAREGCSDNEPDVPCARTGVTPEGVCDLAGNLWEWVADDWHRDYRGAPARGAWCAAPTCAPPNKRAAKTYRGGAWYHDSEQVRATSRAFGRVDLQSEGVGFRCAL
jgi:sulfatase modifying factor 1